MLVCTSFLTFIDIDALTVFQFETVIAFTDTIDTAAMLTAINTLAFVIFLAFVYAVTGEARFTFTCETAFVIDAVGLLVAVV